MTDIADTREELHDRRLELLRRRLAERGLKSTDRRRRIYRRAAAALSDGQRRMWFVQMADPTGAILNICLSYRHRRSAGRRRGCTTAVNAVAARHEVLRTTYAADADGEPQPTVHDDLLTRLVRARPVRSVRQARDGCGWKCWRSASSARRST